MKIYYLMNGDWSGVFSTIEKAWESFLNCAKQEKWTEYEIEEKSEDFFSVMVHQNNRWFQVACIEYLLDEDHTR